jgi:hypothetical protein
MLTTKDQAIQFLTTMQYLHPYLHPEDDCGDYIDDDHNQVFTDDQAKYLNDSFNECYTLLTDPCETIITEIRPKMTMFNPKIK